MAGIKYYCFLHLNMYSGAAIEKLQPSCILFGVVPYVDSTNGITYTVFNYHLRSFFTPVCFWSFSVMVL